MLEYHNDMLNEVCAKKVLIGPETHIWCIYILTGSSLPLVSIGRHTAIIPQVIHIEPYSQTAADKEASSST